MAGCAGMILCLGTSSLGHYADVSFAMSRRGWPSMRRHRVTAGAQQPVPSQTSLLCAARPGGHFQGL